MTKLADIHTALAEAVSSVIPCTPYPPQGRTPPLAWCQLDGWTANAMGRKGQKVYRIPVYVFTAQSTRPQDGYRSLMDYADTGPKSVELAVWDNNTATVGSFGIVTDCSAWVSEFEVLGAEAIDQYEMYGGVFTVEVHTKG